jgi:hypothetical protein
MPDLASFQSAFAETLLAPDPIGRIAAQPGFAVYRNTCVRGAVEALRAGYPTIDALLGADAFTEVAIRFCTRQFPRSPVLATYGAGFACWLARQPWTSELPYLSDVARLDRLWMECHFAGDAPARLAPLPGAVPPPSLKALLHPTARFAWVETPAVTIWIAHRRAGDFEELEPEWRPEGVLFVRRRTAVEARQIDHASYRLLLALAAGASIEDSAAVVTSAFPDADPTAVFDRLIECGALQLW